MSQTAIFTNFRAFCNHFLTTPKASPKIFLKNQKPFSLCIYEVATSSKISEKLNGWLQKYTRTDVQMCFKSSVAPFYQQYSQRVTQQILSITKNNLFYQEWWFAPFDQVLEKFNRWVKLWVKRAIFTHLRAFLNPFLTTPEVTTKIFCWKKMFSLCIYKVATSSKISEKLNESLQKYTPMDVLQTCFKSSVALFNNKTPKGS